MARSNKQKIKSYVDYLWEQNYNQRPVSMNELLSSKEFFGNLTDEGRAVFPIWKEKLAEIQAEDSKPLAVFTGAIGIGKTRAAVWGMGSVMHRILCLKDPYKFLHIAAGGKLSVVFFNLTKSLSGSSSYSLLQAYLCSSPWFCQFGRVMGSKENPYLSIPLFEYLLASPYAKGYGTQGKDVVTAIMDEMNPEGAKPSPATRAQVLKAYEGTHRRFASRFVDDIYHESIGRFFLVASKQEELSFLDTFIAERKHAKDLVIVDLPFWAIRKGTLSGRTFGLTLGDIYTPSKIIKTPYEKQRAITEGRDILNVPIEYLPKFEYDIIGALRDIAGVSVAGIRTSKLFSSERIIIDSFNHDKQDPMSKMTIEIGLKDDVDLIKYIDLTKLTMPRNTPRCIHVDISYADGGDACGFAMSGIKHYKSITEQNADGSFGPRKVPVVETDLAFRLKARRGDQIPMNKIAKLVLDLRDLGFNIQCFSADLNLLSAYMRQCLEQSEIETAYLSLDRDVKPYIAYRDTVNAGQWVCHWHPFINFELKNLEYDKVKQKIDHPDKVVEVSFKPDGSMEETVMIGSKDVADSIAGSVYKVLEYADAIPVDGAGMAKILGDIGRATTPDGQMDKHWFLQKNGNAFGTNGEEYLLQNKQDEYYLWVRESPELSPRVNGPYQTKPKKGMVVVPVEDPLTWMPDTPRPEQPRIDGPGAGQDFLDMLGDIRSQQE